MVARDLGQPPVHIVNGNGANVSTGAVAVGHPGLVAPSVSTGSNVALKANVASSRWPRRTSAARSCSRWAGTPRATTRGPSAA